MSHKISRGKFKLKLQHFMHYVFTPVQTDVHPVNTPPDTGQREWDGRGGHAEHRAFAQRQEVEDRDREDDVCE